MKIDEYKEERRTLRALVATTGCRAYVRKFVPLWGLRPKLEGEAVPTIDKYALYIRVLGNNRDVLLHTATTLKHLWTDGLRFTLTKMAGEGNETNKQATN